MLELSKLRLGSAIPRKATRAEALAELNREAESIFSRRRRGEITLLEAEHLLHELRNRYKTPLDSFLEVS